MLSKFVSAIISLILILTIMLFDASVFATTSNEGNFSVYVNNVFYGNVDDREIFDAYIEEKYAEYNAQSQFGEVYMPTNYAINNIASAFDTSMSDEEIFEAFKENVKFLVDGYKVSIVKSGDNTSTSDFAKGGDVILTTSSKYSILYTTDKEEADVALNRVLETFVDEESIEKLKRGDEMNSFEVGTEETIAYFVDGTVVGTEEKVPYTQVLVGNDLYNKMLFYNVAEDNVYTVEKGDTLETIASKNMLNVTELIAANDTLINENTIIAPGQELVVNLVDPVITVESTKRVVAEEVIPFETEVVEDDTMLNTEDNIVKVEGSNGKVIRVYEFEYLNGQTTNTGEIVSENEIEPSVNKVIVKGTKEPPTYTATYTSTGIAGYVKSSVASDGSAIDWGSAIQGGIYTSRPGPRWGRVHNGIDIAGLPQGSTIMSVYDGVVMFTGYQGARGNLVIIDHLNGYVTYYQHLYTIEVSAGQSVVKGQRIGGVGRTGISTGVHLHFEIYRDGVWVNPDDIREWN